jgi:hypothetical protein
MKTIATKTVRIRLTNGREVQLTEGKPVTKAVLNKLSARYKREYTQELLETAQIIRRIPHRAEFAKQMGFHSDVNLVVMQVMSELFTNEELKAMRTGQLGVLRKIEKQVIRLMQLEDRLVDYKGLTDDPVIWTEAKSWKAWPLHNDEEVMIARQIATDFINDVYTLV